MSHLCPTLCSLLQAEPNKHRVSHFHQDIVDTVHMCVLHTSLFHVCQDVGLWTHQSSIETTITIWGTSNVVLLT